jgi:hypothetical protein
MAMEFIPQVTDGAEAEPADVSVSHLLILDVMPGR